MSEENVATHTDDTYFLVSILCESPVDENSCNDKSTDCDGDQFCSIDCDVSDKTEWYINNSKLKVLPNCQFGISWIFLNIQAANTGKFYQ